MADTTSPIPVFDMQEGLSENPEKMIEALERWGCFRIVNHGVPQSLMADMKSTVRSLFDLPEETKKRNAYAQPLMGYVPKNVSTPTFEALGVHRLSKPHALDEFFNQLDVFPHQREIMHKYCESMKELAEELGRKINKGLGMHGDLFAGWSTYFRMQRYSNSVETLGTTSGQLHTDKGFIAIVMDDDVVGGLEMIDDQTGEFVPIPPMPGTFLINAGDIAKAWSNGRFCNVKHRIQAMEAKLRFSVSYFLLGPTEGKVEVPMGLVDEEHPQLYVPFSYDDFENARHSRNPGNSVGGALEFFRSKK